MSGDKGFEEGYTRHEEYCRGVGEEIFFEKRKKFLAVVLKDLE